MMKRLVQPLLYHRETKFSEILFEVTSHLQKALFTKGKVFLLTASGTGAMEACVQNLVSRYDKTMVISYGLFGERWKELLWRYGAYVDEVSHPYGQSPPLEEIERRLRTNDEVRVVFTTLTETSTGMLADIKEIGRICRENNRLLVVDAICGFGAEEFYTDNWNVDLVCGASQKALALPPGISFVAANERSWELVAKAKSPRYYFDLRRYDRVLNDYQTPYTPAILTIYTLHARLKKILSLGMKRLWQEHKRRAQLFRAQLKGVKFLPDSPASSLSVIKVPPGKDGTKIIGEIKERHKILFANGQRDLRGKIIRVGHMGEIKKASLIKAAKILKRYL